MLIVGMLLTFVVAPRVVAFEDSLAALGVSLITAAVIAFVLDRVSLTALVAEVSDRLDFAFEDLRLRRSGMRAIETGPFYHGVYEELRHSRTFNLVQTWSPDLTNLLNAAEDVVRRGGRVRVYLLHPESEFAKQRGIDLGPGRDHVPDKIRSDARDVRWRYRELRAAQATGTIELYYYNALPAFSLYQVDGTAWVGQYWYGAQSDCRTTLVIDVPSKIWTDYEEHLCRLHKRAVNVPLDTEEEPELPNYRDADTFSQPEGCD